MIDDSDLEKLFVAPKAGAKPVIKTILSYLGTFVVIFVIVFVIVNFSALYSLIGYWYQNDIKVSDEKNNYAPSIISSESNNITTAKENLPKVDDNHVLIPKINVDAPISWDILNDDARVQDALTRGVAHLANTSKPGQAGNAFITGHSSNYLWAKGNYKNIFSLLNKLVVGDLVYIKYKNKLYIYRTTKVSTVKPNDTSVLKADPGSYLTLMTCTPVGTSINRLIIHADQLFPDPKSNSSNPFTNDSKLPKGVR